MFTITTLTDDQARSLVVVVGIDNESGIEMMAGTSLLGQFVQFLLIIAET